MLSRLPRGRCLSKYLMVSTRAQHGRLTTKPSHESFRDPPGGQVAVEQSDTAAIKQEIALASPKPHPEVLQKAAETLLGADRPGADAPKIKKKVKVNRLQPSVSATDLPHLQAKAERIYKILMDLFEDPPCPLDHKSSFQLLVSVILSAQTTDKKVNEVTPQLFALAPDAARMSELEVSTIEQIVRFVGLAPTKAKNLSKMSQMLVAIHSGQVPQTFDELEVLPGVGHKTASVVMAVAFGLPTFPVDTHIHRLAQRWGLTDGKSVEQTEVDLKLLWQEDCWNPLHLRLIYFGREHCPAQGHDPSTCAICSWAAVPPYNRPGASPAKAGQKPSANLQPSKSLTQPESDKASSQPKKRRRKDDSS